MRAATARFRYLGAPLFVAVGMVVFVLGIVFYPGDPYRQDLMQVLQPPGPEHWLGTDHLGRDVFARVLHGSYRSVGIAMICVSVSVGVGGMLGLACALRGGLFDTLVMRAADVTLALPGIVVALAFAAFFGGGVLPIILGLNLSFWPSFARMARAIALSTLNENHVEAARLAGFSSMAILRNHLLPPVLHRLSGLIALNIGVAIISISSLGFLGFGLQPPEPEWGGMISELIPYMASAPAQIGGPCLAIFLTVSGMSALASRLEYGRVYDA